MQGDGSMDDAFELVTDSGWGLAGYGFDPMEPTMYAARTVSCDGGTAILGLNLRQEHLDYDPWDDGRRPAYAFDDDPTPWSWEITDLSAALSDGTAGRRGPVFQGDEEVLWDGSMGSHNEAPDVLDQVLSEIRERHDIDATDLASNGPDALLLGMEEWL